MILFVLILHPVLRTVSSLNTSAKVRQTDEENEGIKTFYPQKEKPATYIIKSVTSKQEEYAIQRKRTEQKGF